MIVSLHQLLVIEAREMLSAERQLIDALPSMLDVLRSTELRDELDAHLGGTRRRFVRVQDALADLGAEPGGDPCEAMEGMIAEAEELIDGELAPALLDVAIALAVQKIGHYQIASYRGLVALAGSCAAQGAARCFGTGLEEQRAAALRIERLAEAILHPVARGAERETAGQDDGT